MKFKLKKVTKLVDCTPYCLRHARHGATLRKLQKTAGGVEEAWPSFFMLSVKDTVRNNRFVEFSEVVEELEDVTVFDPMHPKATVSGEKKKEMRRRRNATFGRRVRIDVVNSEILVLSQKKGIGGRHNVKRRYKMQAVTRSERIHETQLDLDVVVTKRRGLLRRAKQATLRMHWFMGSPTQRDYLAALIQGLCGSRRGALSSKLLGSPLPAPRSLKSLRIWCGTWNMGGSQPPKSLRPWTTPRGTAPHDIYAFGVQEASDAVFAKISSEFDNKQFVWMAKVSMGGIGLCVLVRRVLVGLIDNVETVHQADGVAGVGTNKGFVAAAFSLFDQPLLFINCHMAARATFKRLRDRNMQFRTCVRKLRLGRVPNAEFVHQFSVFWMGDFNYRVYAREHWSDITQSRADVLKKIREASVTNASLADLVQYDQLSQQMQDGAVFCGFKDTTPTFCPSYKYVHFSHKEVWTSVFKASGELAGVDFPGIEPTELTKSRAAADGVHPKGYYITANRRVQRKDYTNKKNQVPSWCDRILTRSLGSVELERENYFACDEIVCSDHSPVSASFKMTIPRSPPPTSMFLVCVLQLQHVRFSMKSGSTVKRPKGQSEKSKNTTRRLAEDAKCDLFALQKRIARKTLALAIQSTIFVDSTKFSHVNSRTAKLNVSGGGASHRSGVNVNRLSSRMGQTLFNYEWRTNDLPTIGPFLTTREFIREQTAILHVVPSSTSSPHRKLASCHIPLSRALSDDGMHFQANMQHQGVDIGTLSGKVRVAFQPLSWSPSMRSEVMNAFKLSVKGKRLAKLPRSSATLSELQGRPQSMSVSTRAIELTSLVPLPSNVSPSARVTTMTRDISGIGVRRAVSSQRFAAL